MIDFPREPNPGENLDASWGARVVRALRALFPMPGPGINVSTGPTGTTISAIGVPVARPAISVECCPAVVETVYAAIPGAYRVRLYPEGLGGHAGATALLCSTERGVELGLVSGTVVLAHAVALAAAEDGEDSE